MAHSCIDHATKLQAGLRHGMCFHGTLKIAAGIAGGQLLRVTVHRRQSGAALAAMALLSFFVRWNAVLGATGSTSINRVIHTHSSGNLNMAS